MHSQEIHLFYITPLVHTLPPCLCCNKTTGLSRFDIVKSSLMYVAIHLSYLELMPATKVHRALFTLSGPFFSHQIGVEKTSAVTMNLRLAWEDAFLHCSTFSSMVPA